MLTKCQSHAEAVRDVAASQSALCSAPASITTAGAVISTNPGSAYANFQTCTWTITAPAGQLPMLTFTAFNTETNYDFFRVFDGSSTAAGVLFSRSGSLATTSLAPLTGTQATLTVTFSSDVSVVLSGVQATVSFVSVGSCSQPGLISAAGTTMATNVGSSTYSNNQACSWTITAPSGMVPVISFSSFQTELNYDFVRVFDGPNVGSAVLLAASGSAVPAAVTGSGSSVLVTFSSDFSVVFGGVVASVSFVGQSPCSLPAHITAAGTIINTNAGLGAYTNGQACAWTITAAAGLPTLTFSAFNTELSFDYFRVYDGPTTSSAALLQLSGSPSPLPGPVTASQATMLVTFSSDASVTAAGVAATVSFSRSSAPCSAPASISLSGTTLATNPGAGSYINMQSCVWAIAAPAGQHATLTFAAFATEATFDVLTVYDGPTASAPVLLRASGQSVPSAVSSTGPQMLVTFSSDVSVVGAGVRAVVSFASSPTPPPVVCSSSCSHCLSYRGGPVLTHAQVVPVYWSSGVTFQGQLNAFYSDVFQSSWFGNLAQYNVLSGTRGAPVVASLALGAYSDAQIQGQLRAMITAGTVPAPRGSTYYPIHFPAGVSIQAGDGTRSCVQWCAYHGTFVHNGVHVQYGIVPDQGGSCAGGCGGNAQLVNNLISVSSHELVETLTDPAVGLAVTLNDGNLAWYNNQFGEIGDICNAQQTTITAAGGASYVVQKEWSNCAQACV